MTPPIRKARNQFLCTLPLYSLLFLYLSAFFEKSENLGSDKFADAHTTQMFQFRHLNFSPTVLDIHFLFTRRLPNYTFCLPSV